MILLILNVLWLKFLHEIVYNFQLKKYNCDSTQGYNG